MQLTLFSILLQQYSVSDQPKDLCYNLYSILNSQVYFKTKRLITSQAFLPNIELQYQQILQESVCIVEQRVQKSQFQFEDLLKLNGCLKAIVDDPKLITETADKDYRKFFFEDMAVGALKRLSLEKSRDEKYLDVIAQIFENYMRLFLALLKLGYYEPTFFDSLRPIFTYDSILNLYNYQIPEEELKRLRSQDQQWRQELKVGDMVDAIIDELSFRCSGWSQARIDQINGDTLHLEFLYDVKTADRYIDRWSLEIAQFESKTKETFEWRKTLEVNSLIDAHDKSVWNKSTILEIKEQQINETRSVKLANIGFRVYMENGKKNDEKGNYEGWSNRFDEWISIYSPRIQGYLSKTLKGSFEDNDLNDDYDALVRPSEGQTRVYAVPRVRKCISRMFLNMMNLFGNEGGFDLVLECLKQDETTPPKVEGFPMNLNIVGILVSNLSNPYAIYHKEFITEYAPKFVEICVQKLRAAPEKSLRDVRRERIESIIKSIDNFQRRLITKEEREKQTEVLKLEVALMCLRSSFLERKIQGIKDLNTVISNNRMFQFKSISAEFLIEWINGNGIYDVLFETKQTHRELVQRSADILKLLLNEGKLTLEILDHFWSLSRVGEYRVEVYKIINELSIWLNQEHIDHIYKGIRQIAPEKMTLEEFQCLCELGKQSKVEGFKKTVADFFWDIVGNSDNYKDELVTNCITKFADMVKYWDVSLKHKLFLQLTQNLSSNKSSIPSLRLFKSLLKDQKDRYQYTYVNPQSAAAKTTTTTTVTAEDGTTTTEITTEPVVPVVDMTLATSLQELIDQSHLPTVLLDNLRTYITDANSKLALPTDQDRKKLFPLNGKYSHHEEVEERLLFVRYIAQVSGEYQISKNELDVVYQLLAIESFVRSDQEEFLTWCKGSCEQSTPTCQILDLNEVGEFFSEKMNNGSLDVRNLLEVGFDFLQQYFISANEKAQKLIKTKAVAEKKDTKITSFTYTGYGYVNSMGGYGPIKPITKIEKKDEAKLGAFKILKHPRELDKLEIVWNIALQCINPPVVQKAVDFLIKVYYSLDHDLAQHKISIQDDFIQRCMEILKEESDEHTRQRVLFILKSLIIEAEKKGTADVRPHSSLLKGELLEKLIIRNRASPNILSITISIYSNTTAWEFKNKIAQRLGLAPKYLKLVRSNNKSIKDTENGKTLGELGFQSHEIFTAEKIQLVEDIPHAPLVTPQGQLTEKAAKIFNEWFDMYSNDDDKMTKETCAQFIHGCTGEKPTLSDDRIGNLFKTYDKNNDGFIERTEFMEFYLKASRDKGDTVRDNLRHHNIRPDLKKLSEVKEEESFEAQDMPRLKISQNEEYFDLLMSLLDKETTVSESSWDLIQMLATSPQIYTRVLELKAARVEGTGAIDWEKFFDSNSVYKLLYTLQIVEAVMEEGEGEGLEKVDVLDTSNTQKKAGPIPIAPPLAGSNIVPPNGAAVATPPTQIVVEELSEAVAEAPTVAPVESADRKKQEIIDKSEDNKLKSQWTKMFLEGDGFHYILKVFMSKELKSPAEESSAKSNDWFELKHMAFLLKLLRIFILAAFSTSAESSTTFAGSSLVRRSSTNPESDDTSKALEPAASEGSRFDQLQFLLKGPIGEKIISGIDYHQIMLRILSVSSQILIKKHMVLEDKLIIENALSLIVGCIMHKNELLHTLYDYTSPQIPSFEEFVLTGLLYNPQEKVREEFNQSLACLSLKLALSSEVRERPLNYLLRLLSSKFTIVSEYQCKQYFELFCDQIDQYFLQKSIGALSGQEEVFNPETLLSQIIDKIKEYNRAAKQQNDQSSQQSSEDIESIYIGLVQLTGKIINNFDISMSERIVESKNLIDEIFTHFLFSSVFSHQESEEGKSTQVATVQKVKPKRLYGEVDTSKSANILGKNAKDAAYNLLNNLIRKSPLLMNQFLSKSMANLLKLIKRHDGWNYMPPGSAAEGKQKYVGLRNLGCICYMNAMMQQFFMIPAFRYNVLSVDDGNPEDLQEYRGKMIDDNVLHQWQKLMAHLELSDRNEYNPMEFCFAFKDFEGNPTNTAEQKDAQEFLNMAFDRMENLLRGTSRKYLVQSVFGGQTCSQVVCSECGTCKNRVEDFYNLSLTVKDTKSMADSLQKLIEGEIINDFQCDTCNKKVDISKRTLLSSAPNVLIVHLQRIIFNFNTFRNDKINSYFEFPSHLDLSPYSFYDVMKREGRLDQQKKKDDGAEEEAVEAKPSSDADGQTWPDEESCWEYKLVGVIVHSGSANAGHYWSYINTRRGHAEPASDDPNWAKTEQEQWMEFNDSTVRGFNFEKLKEECFGGDSGSDGWGWGGSSGKSAYMLVYERKQKKPIKVLVDPASITGEALFDEKKEEHYQLLDYKGSVEEINASKIYQQVAEDNKKFEFDNDIYSQEFFDFVKGILVSVKESIHQTEDAELLSSITQHTLSLGKKTILDLLAKCFHNTAIKPLSDALCALFKEDAGMAKTFIEGCFKEDGCSYLMDVLLECSDGVVRTHISNLLKQVITTLKKSERDKILLRETIELKDDKTGEITRIEQPAATVSRFIMKMLSLLNTQVAKCWSRFEGFLDVLYCFGTGLEENSIAVTAENIKDGASAQEDTIGMEFLMSVKFMEKACDFMLGKKSPLLQLNEKRFEMGGSYTQPNFTPLVKLLSKIMTDPELLARYPLNENEQKMFLHADLLKVMLGSTAGGKQFGNCLASMCRDNIKMSRKVAKVFLKSISNATYENVKCYLTALKPFVKLEDSLRQTRLEWIFGISQIMTRKKYQQDHLLYGLELVDRISEESSTYISTLGSSYADDCLLASLLRSKGKFDTFAINCLKELLSLMSKDTVIARHVYFAAPSTYQMAHYSDWIRYYLEYQKGDVERSNSFAYFKFKYDAIIKALEYLRKFESEQVEKFKEEEQARMEKDLEEDKERFTQDVQKDWLAFNHNEVITHYPPLMIIGKQSQDDITLQTHDEDPLVKVTLSEVACEYNFSNPTGYFNLSIPHIEIKTNNFQTLSYAQYRQNLYESERKEAQDKLKAQQAEETKKAAEASQSTENTENADVVQENVEAVKDPQDEEVKATENIVDDGVPVELKAPEVIVRNWFECKREGPVLVKVSVTNREKKKVKAAVRFEAAIEGQEEYELNVRLPKSEIKVTFFDADTLVVLHLTKINPLKPIGQIKIIVRSTDISPIPTAPPLTGGAAVAPAVRNAEVPMQVIINLNSVGSGGEIVVCDECNHRNYQGMQYCEKCGESLPQMGTNVIDNYYTTGGAYGNSMY